MQQLTKFVKTSNIIALSFMVLTFVGCSKGGDTPTPTPPTPNPPPVVIIESDIAFSVKIDGTEVNYNGIFGVVGNSVTIDANITSTMPLDGVKIKLEVFPKLPNQAAFFTKEIPLSKQASNPILVTGLKPGEHCYAKVTVTSISKAEKNTATKQFDLAAK